MQFLNIKKMVKNNIEYNIKNLYLNIKNKIKNRCP